MVILVIDLVGLILEHSDQLDRTMEVNLISLMIIMEDIMEDMEDIMVVTTVDIMVQALDLVIITVVIMVQV